MQLLIYLNKILVMLFFKDDLVKKQNPHIVKAKWLVHTTWGRIKTTLLAPLKSTEKHERHKDLQVQPSIS